MSDAERWTRISAWFDELVELDPAARAIRLEAIEAAEPAAASELRALLEADARDHGLLDDDAAGALGGLIATGTTAPLPADGRIGAYHVLRPIGEGGMGTVYLAERADGAFEQRVAIKVIKRGMDSAAVLQRFLRERRILARLAHGHIVRLLDGGVGADGRPYYVMEYVDGETLERHVNARRLPPRERVALVARIAEAVAYAHALLVVHRDLKPSNVIVDAHGAPRVLDFGIAKLLEPGDDAAATGTGQQVLSPAYAAPEQILGEAVGTASDVYALGLVLCELLVGELPRRRGATPAQRARDAASELVERPSMLAARLPPARVESLYGTAMSARRLARALKGDLDIIVATALQREPARRYPTAAAFADDLSRWLEGRPIEARADSRGYRLARFVRRHRVGVAASALVVASLFVGLGSALWQAQRAHGQAVRAEAERANAERQLARTDRVKDYVLALFREQDPISRARAQARTPTELIRSGVAQVDTRFAQEPDLRAELLRDLGEIQIGLGDRDQARATLQRAFDLQTRLSGADSAATALTLARLGEATFAAGDAAGATTLLRDALPRLRAGYGADSREAAAAEASLATFEHVAGNRDEAFRLASHALAVARTFGDAPEIAMRLAEIGRLQQESSQYDAALRSFDEALHIIERDQGERHARTVILHAQIGDVLRYQRRYEESQRHYETALAIEREQLPAGHALVGSTLLRLGDLQRRRGRLDEAEHAFAEALSILPEGNAQRAQALQYSAELAEARGRFELALERHRAAFATFRRATGDSLYTWLAATQLMQAMIQAGRLADADALAAEAMPAIARVSEAEGYERAVADAALGRLRHAQHRFAEAIALRRHALAVMTREYGERHVETARACIELASSLSAAADASLRVEAGALLGQAARALDGSADPQAEDALGLLHLERARLHVADSARAEARADLAHATARLQTPRRLPQLREAQALARSLR